jgi:phage terminase large subunit-like protein
VIETWGTEGQGNYYLLDLWRGKVEYPDLIKTIHTQHAKWHTVSMPVAIIIEDKASGQSALQTLRKPVPQMDGTVLPALPVVPFPQPGNDQQKALAALSKVARADGVTPLIEGGRVFLPAQAEWLDAYLAELERFPNGVHDDQVDPTSMALARLPRTGVRAY